MALKQFETEFNFPKEKIDWYLLDLLNHRDLSNERNVRSNKRGEELDLSGSRKDCTSLCSNE